MSWGRVVEAKKIGSNLVHLWTQLTKVTVRPSLFLPRLEAGSCDRLGVAQHGVVHAVRTRLPHAAGAPLQATEPTLAADETIETHR